MPKVLAIDDQQDNLITISALLKNLIPDCIVITSDSGAEGIKKAEAEQPDTILLDIKMPGMDGFEVCRHLKSNEETKHIPVIMMTAIKTDSQRRVKGFEIGADAFLSKPIDETELAAQVKVMLRIKTAEDLLRKEKDLLEDTVHAKTTALRENEAFWKTLINAIPVPVFYKDRDGKYLGFNSAFETFFGETKELLIGKSVFDINPPELAEIYRAQDDELFNSGGVQLYESQVKNAHGKLRDIIFNKAVFTDSKGAVTGLIGAIIDITERRRAEEALRESERELNAILDATTETIVLFDRKGIVHAANKTVCDRLGTTKEEFIGKRLYDFFSPKVAEGRRQKWNEVFETGKPVSFEDSREGMIFEHMAYPILGDGDQVKKVVAFANDKTDRKQAEEALRESEEKHRTVLDSNPDPVVVYDMEGKVIYLNRAFARVFGWSLEEQTGKKIDDFVPEENWPETRMMINKVTVLGESFSGLETRRYTKEGNVLDISISGSCYRDQEGNIAASVINLRDITEQKKLQTRYQQTQKMEAIATLAGGVAHEFNNALMGIMGNIELLKMDLPEDERRDKYFERMKGSGHRMSRLTDQLLAYAQGGKYQPKDLKLDDFVIQTVPILQHDLNPAVRVETHFPKDISYIKTNYAQMQMVLSAVLANSNEGIEDEGLIRITAENKDVDEDFTKHHPGLKSGPYVCLTIEDDGKGMDEETRSGIFEPFFTTKFQGRGMGMAAVYGIIKSHDGAITVESEPGKGTVVRIYLPAIEAKEEVKKEVVLRPTVELATGEGTILVIEDEEVLVKMFSQILEILGYRVLEAKTGKQAVELAKTFDGQIDLALLDIKLPDMEGGKIYPLIMEARPDLKVIVCSGYNIHGPAQDILDAGAEGFIQKPFSIAPFAEKLKEVLEGK